MTPSSGVQLSLFESSPDPAPAAPAPQSPAPTLKTVEPICTEFLIQGDRPGLVAYLSGFCAAGHAEWVGRFCQLRIDFGLKVRAGTVVEFFQVGDLVQIYNQGQFYGKVVGILALCNGIATVRGENWVVDHQYSVAVLRLVKRRKDA